MSDLYILVYAMSRKFCALATVMEPLGQKCFEFISSDSAKVGIIKWACKCKKKKK